MQYSSFYFPKPVITKSSDRRLVPVEMCGISKMTPQCLSDTCFFRKECASHTTAGDFRSEDGFTPQLRPEGDGKWSCTQKETSSLGMLIWDKDILGYRAWGGVYEDL